MPRSAFLGEWEQLVLLAILRQRDAAYVIGLREHLAVVMGRTPSRGALYRTLDRLEDKAYIKGIEEDASPDRGGHPRRRFDYRARSRRLERPRRLRWRRGHRPAQPRA